MKRRQKKQKRKKGIGIGFVRFKWSCLLRKRVGKKGGKWAIGVYNRNDNYGLIMNIINW